jgi:hypothetical protein
MSIVMMGAAVFGHGSAGAVAAVAQPLTSLPVWLWVVLGALSLLSIWTGFRFVSAVLWR